MAIYKWKKSHLGHYLKLKNFKSLSVSSPVSCYSVVIDNV